MKRLSTKSDLWPVVALSTLGSALILGAGLFASSRRPAREAVTAATQMPLPEITPAPKIFAGDFVQTMDFSPNGSLLVGSGSGGHGGWNSVLLVWDAKSRRLLRRNVGENEDQQSGGHFQISPDNRTIAVAAMGTSIGDATPTLLLRDLESGKVLHKLKAPIGDFWSFRFTPNGKALLTISGLELSNRGTLTLWDVRSGTRVRTWEFDGYGLSLVEPLPGGGKYLLTKNFYHRDEQTKATKFHSELWEWSLQTEEFTRLLWRGREKEGLVNLALSPDARYAAGVGLVGGGVDGEAKGTLRIFADLQTGRTKQKFTPGLQNFALNLSFAQDSRHVFVPIHHTPRARFIETWDARNGRLVREVGHNAISTFAANPRENIVAFFDKPNLEILSTREFLP